MQAIVCEEWVDSSVHMHERPLCANQTTALRRGQQQLHRTSSCYLLQCTEGKNVKIIYNGNENYIYIYLCINENILLLGLS